MLRINEEDEDLVNLDDYGAFYEYKGKLFTGIIYEETPEGQVIEEQTFLNGQLDGISRSWYNDGELISEQYFKEGKAHGWYRAWHHHPTNKLATSILFEKGEAVKYQKWAEDRRLEAQKFETGEEIFWDEDSHVKEFRVTKKEPYHHKLKQAFFPSGKLKSELIDAKFFGWREGIGFDEAYQEWNEEGTLMKFEQQIWAINKRNRQNSIHYQVEKSFHKTGKIAIEKITTSFLTSLRGNEHIWREEKRWTWGTGKLGFYKKDYLMKIRQHKKDALKETKKEKRQSVYWHKRNPFFN